MTTPFPNRWVRGLRDGQGLTRAELAARVGCSPEAVKTWELGQFVPSEHYLTRLADALAVSVADLARDADDAERDYIAGVLHHARPLTDAELSAAARELRRTRRQRRGRVNSGDAA